MERRVARRIVVSLLAAAAVAAVLPAGGGAATQQPAVALSPLEGGVLGGINALRAEHGLTQLRLSPALTAAARAHTEEMAADGYFEHESYDGQAFWKRIAAYYPQGNRPFWSVGENLLYASPDIDADGTVQAWLDSPEHRANMLNPRWRDIGVGAVHALAAPGEYDGQDVTIVTVDFGVRSSAPTRKAPIIRSTEDAAAGRPVESVRRGPSRQDILEYRTDRWRRP